MHICVNDSNISGYTDNFLNEQVWLPNNEYVGYCPNYLCVYAQYIDAHVYKFEVCTTRVSRVTNINVVKREQIWLPINEKVGYCPNYLCSCAWSRAAHVCKT